MLSSLNTYGGLSAAEILMLFGANSPSSSLSSKSTSADAAQSASATIDASGANNPVNAIQAILAKAEMTTSTGGWGSIDSVQMAYANETSNSSFVVSESVAIVSPHVVQLGEVSLFENTSSPQTEVNLSGTPSPASADPIEIAMSNGAISVTEMKSAASPNGLPSASSIQQALNVLKMEDEQIGWDGVEGAAAGIIPESEAKDEADAWWDSLSGSITLVELPPSDNGSFSQNVATFTANRNGWALVLPQNSVSVTVSETQTTG